MTTKDGILKQSTWWPYLLFCKYMRGHTVATHVSSSVYDGETEPRWLQAAADMPWLDVSAAISDDDWVSLVVVNIHLEESLEVALDGVSGKAKVYTVTGKHWDVVNTAEEENVGVAESEWDGHGKYTFPKQSMTMLRWKA